MIKRTTVLAAVVFVLCQGVATGEVLDQQTWIRKQSELAQRCATRKNGNDVDKQDFDERERPKLLSLLRRGTQLDQWVGKLSSVQLVEAPIYAKGRVSGPIAMLSVSTDDLSMEAYNLSPESPQPVVSRDKVAALEASKLVKITGTIRSVNLGDVCNAPPSLVVSLEDVRMMDVREDRKAFFDRLAGLEARLAVLDQGVEATSGHKLERYGDEPTRHVMSYKLNRMEALKNTPDGAVCNWLKKLSPEYTGLYESISGQSAASLDCEYTPFPRTNAQPWSPEPYLEELLSVHKQAYQIESTLREGTGMASGEMASRLNQLSKVIADAERKMSPKLEAYDKFLRGACSTECASTYSRTDSWCNGLGFKTSTTRCITGMDHPP